MQSLKPIACNNERALPSSEFALCWMLATYNNHHYILGVQLSSYGGYNKLTTIGQRPQPLESHLFLHCMVTELLLFISDAKGK